MSAIPYMPLYVADYLADTAHLTTEESGAYMLLILNYWQRGKPLPADPIRLANIARLSNERWTDVQRTLNEFFTEIDGEWRHKRIEAELAKFHAKSDKAKKAGKASGKARSGASPERTLNERSTDVQLEPNGRSTDVQRTLNHTDTDTDKSLSSTVLVEAARVPRCAAPPDDFIDRLTEAAQPCLDNPVNCLGLLNCGTPQMWLNEGCDLERDVLPVLRAAAIKHKGKRIRDWNYFTGMISEAKARRERGLPSVSLPDRKPTASSTFSQPPKRSEAEEYAANMALAHDMGIITDEQYAHARQ